MQFRSEENGNSAKVFLERAVTRAGESAAALERGGEARPDGGRKTYFERGGDWPPTRTVAFGLAACSLLEWFEGGRRVAVRWRRAQVALLRAAGCPRDAVTEIVGCDRATVSRVWRRYRAEGVNGLDDRPRSGAPRKPRRQAQRRRRGAQNLSRRSGAARPRGRLQPSRA